MEYAGQAAIEEGGDPSGAARLTVCGSFLIGDHLSFMANFQPNLIVPLFVGKLLAGACAVIIAQLLVIPKLKTSEALETAEVAAAST